MAKLPIL